jgi:hypothetical protein
MMQTGMRWSLHMNTDRLRGGSALGNGHVACTDFINVGAPKSATTWLDALLRHHPDVELPFPMKETFFFDRHFDRGSSWYDACFAGNERLRRGEIAPSYFSNQSACERIAACLSGIKIVISLREPFARAYSHFKHHHRKGRVGSSFWEATRQQPDILESSRYSVWGPKWLKLAGTGRYHLILQDDVEISPDRVWRDLCAFLEIEQIPMPSVGTERVYEGGASRSRALAFLLSWSANVAQGLGLHRLVAWARDSPLKAVMSGGKPPLPLSPGDKERLREYFRDDVAWAEEQCQRKLVNWY